MSLRVPHGTAPALDDPLSRQLLQRYEDSRNIVALDIYLGHGQYYGVLLIRELRLVAVAIENVGDKPIGLEAYRARSLSAPDLLSLASTTQVDERMASTGSHEYELPVEMLLPGEQLFIPLRLELGYQANVPRDDYMNSEISLTRESLPNVKVLGEIPGDTVRFKIFRGLDVDGTHGVTEVHEVTKDILRSKINFARLYDVEYSLGDAVQVEEVVFRLDRSKHVDYPIRPLEPTNLVVSGGYEVGSCPIVYARVGPDWIRVGPVLVDAFSRDLAKTERRSGPQASSWRLVEEEDETSFIDSVRLILRYPDGRSVALEPTGRQLVPDMKFEVLRRGDNLQLDFNLPLDAEAAKFELEVQGYYIPDRLLADVAARLRGTN